VITPTPVQPVTPVPSDPGGNSDGFVYSVYNGAAAITGYTGNASAVTIPKTIDGYPVKQISISAFTQKTGIVSVTINADLDSIGASAFTQCTGLRELIINGNVREIGASAFAQCTSLTSIKVSDSGGLENIGMSAFVQCTSLKNLYLNSKTVSVGMSAFMQCNSLSAVYFHGTESEWRGIYINMGNEPLNYAVVYLI